jgi:hypothetical protein
VLTTCQPSTVWCSRERLPAAAAQPAKVPSEPVAPRILLVLVQSLYKDLILYVPADILKTSVPVTKLKPSDVCNLQWCVCVCARTCIYAHTLCTIYLYIQCYFSEKKKVLECIVT